MTKIHFHTLAGLKRWANRIKKEEGIPLHQALEIVAREGGFYSYSEAQKALSQ